MNVKRKLENCKSVINEIADLQQERDNEFTALDIYNESERAARIEPINQKFHDNVMKKAQEFENISAVLPDIFDADISSSEDTSSKLTAPLMYLNTAGADYKADDLDAVIQPLKVAKDFASLKILYDLAFKSNFEECQKSKLWPFCGVMDSAKEAKRKINVLAAKMVNNIKDMAVGDSATVKGIIQGQSDFIDLIIEDVNRFEIELNQFFG